MIDSLRMEERNRNKACCQVVKEYKEGESIMTITPIMISEG